MTKDFLSKLWYQAWSLILVEMSGQELAWLFRPGRHLSLLAARRTTIVVTRVRLVAGLFAVLTPLWVVIDIMAFPAEVWHGLVAARLAATVAFAAILVALRRMDSMSDAYRALGMLLAVPTSFFLFSYQHMSQFELHGVQAAFAAGYAFLPFVMLAGLSIFPLTLIESLSFATPMLMMQVLAAALRWPIFDWPTVAASFWLLLLITAVSALAGLSQLGFMIVLVRESIRDRMTGCFSRHSGEELIELQFVLAERSQTPLAVAFLDLDHFKQINDRHGHDAGDQALVNAAGQMRLQLRTGDMLTRWGGEEFLIVMPNTGAAQAENALQRVRQAGLGQRPDGTPLTASIGIAERLADGAADWRQLVEKADARMYQAKQAGRDRIVAAA